MRLLTHAVIIALASAASSAAPLSTQFMTLAPYKDTFYTINGALASESYGSRPYIMSFDNTGTRSFALMAFDLPQAVIGSADRVSKCTMTLGKFNLPPTGPVNVFITATSSDWDEQKVNGLNAPAIMGETMQVVVTDFSDSLIFDATYLCKIAAGSGGSGVSVRIDSPQALYTTSSRENGSQASLSIEY